jgi:hypothetical protein
MGSLGAVFPLSAVLRADAIRAIIMPHSYLDESVRITVAKSLFPTTGCSLHLNKKAAPGAASAIHLLDKLLP